MKARKDDKQVARLAKKCKKRTAGKRMPKTDIALLAFQLLLKETRGKLDKSCVRQYYTLCKEIDPGLAPFSYVVKSEMMRSPHYDSKSCRLTVPLRLKDLKAIFYMLKRGRTGSRVKRKRQYQKEPKACEKAPTKVVQKDQKELVAQISNLIEKIENLTETITAVSNDIRIQNKNARRRVRSR